VPNVPDDVVIIEAIKGLRVGQCTSHFGREPPNTVLERYKVMQKFCKSNTDHRKRVEEETSFRVEVKNNCYNQPIPTNFERRPTPSYLKSMKLTMKM
jgi:hypothetical protein